MDPCNECGNSSVRAAVIDGVAVLECELCGALGGSAQAVRRVQDARQARASGVDPRVFGLVRALGALPGIRVHEHHAGDAGVGRGPFVSWLAVDARGLVQLENLAKLLVLAGGSLGLPWAIGVEYRDSLAFVLRPQFGAAIGIAEVAQAQRDLGALQRALERDVRLSWWRHPPA